MLLLSITVRANRALSIILLLMLLRSVKLSIAAMLLVLLSLLLLLTRVSVNSNICEWKWQKPITTRLHLLKACGILTTAIPITFSSAIIASHHQVLANGHWDRWYRCQHHRRPLHY